jgi:hypothetical protein
MFCFIARLPSWQKLRVHFLCIVLSAKMPIVKNQTMRFHPRKCLFGVSLKKFDFTGSVTPKNRQKVGVVYGFPAKLGESIKTHISVKSRDIDTKFEP